MITRVRQWFLQIAGRSVVPLIQRALIVTRAVSGVLGYVLTEIISGKLEIPDNTIITNTLTTILDAIKAVTKALESALEFMGLDAPAPEVEATSTEEHLNRLNSSTEDLKNLINSLKK